MAEESDLQATTQEKADGNFDKQPPIKLADLPRPDTTVIRLESDKDIVMDESRARHHSEEKKKQKALSQVPYDLNRLHRKRPLYDALRRTKMRDLFHFSYVFRYIVCILIGCISFVSLVILWKFVFRIDECAIEDDNLSNLRFMPFAYGFVMAYKLGLIIVAPMFYVLLPTVNVIHAHRVRFIIAWLSITFLVFACYGFYGVSWRKYSYIGAAILAVAALMTFLYWGGYYAMWVIFPLFSATVVAFLLTVVMREYVWSKLSTQPVYFGVVYPMYLTLLQMIAFKCMLWLRLPFKIRQYFANICPSCCCRNINEHSETPVYWSRENFDNFWTPSTYDLKYIEKRSTKNTMPEATEHTSQVSQFESIQTKQELQNDDDDAKKESDMNENVAAADDEKHARDDTIGDAIAVATPKSASTAATGMTDEATTQQHRKQEDTAVIIASNKKLNTEHTGAHSSHRYRSTELELSVEDVWSNDTMFVAGGTVIVLMESMRVAGLVALKRDIGALVVSILSSILLECASRNNLYWECIYRCVLRRPNPPLSRFYSSVLGTRYQTEYIPYFVIAMMNLTVFAPGDCTKDAIDDSLHLPLRSFWWMYVVLFGSEILSDAMSEFVKKMGRKHGVFGDEENGDPAREATYVKLRPWMMVCLFITFFGISLLAFETDFAARKGI